MNIFGEPELGIDYIMHQYPSGKNVRHYKMRCNHCNKITFKQKRGKRNYKNVYCTLYCQNKGLSIHRCGLNNPSWKGGISAQLLILRRSQEYGNWIVQVFERDNYTCQDCGQYGGNLEAHHLIMVSENQDRMFDIDNGRTLCIPCHKLTLRHEIEYRESL